MIQTHTHTQLLSVRPGTQTFQTDIVPLTLGVVMELVLHVLAQSCEMAVLFIRAPPGEVVAADAVAEAEAAGRVGFNCACLRRHVDEEADLSRHSMNTDTHAAYCCSEVCILRSAACRCLHPRCHRATSESSACR